MGEDIDTSRRRETLKNDRERFRGALEKINTLESQPNESASLDGDSGPSRIVDPNVDDDGLNGSY